MFIGSLSPLSYSRVVGTFSCSINVYIMLLCVLSILDAGIDSIIYRFRFVFSLVLSINEFFGFCFGIYAF